MGKKKSIGLPGGPNEFLQDITQYISVEGYKSYSPDKNNPVNIIESSSITMQDVDIPVLGMDNLGNAEVMFSPNNYEFPGDMVLEIPLAKDGNELPKAQRGIIKPIAKKAATYLDDILEYFFKSSDKATKQIDKAVEETPNAMSFFSDTPKRLNRPPAEDYVYYRNTNDGSNIMLPLDFENPRVYSNWKAPENLSFFTPNNNSFKDYGAQKWGAKINPTKPFIEKKPRTYTVEEVQKLIDDGYDAIITQSYNSTDIRDAYQVIPLDKKIIKNLEQLKAKGGSVFQDGGGDNKPMETVMLDEVEVVGEKKKPKKNWFLNTLNNTVNPLLIADNALQILGIPAALVRESIEGIGGKGDGKFNFGDIIPDLYNTTILDSDKKQQPVSQTLGVDGFWKSLGVDLLTDPTTYVGAGIVKNLLAKGGKKVLPKVVKQLTTKGAKSTDDILKQSDEFISEINWGKWNKDIPNNKSLMDEYADIEKSAKANGTWMKNADGSPFTLPDGSPGLPEQFIQMRSKNFKNAYPEGIDVTYRGSDQHIPEGMRGEYSKIYNNDAVRPEVGSGLFTGDIKLASQYGKGYYGIDNPNLMSPVLNPFFTPNQRTLFEIPSNQIQRNIRGQNITSLSPNEPGGIYKLAIPKTKNKVSFDANRKDWTNLADVDIWNMMPKDVQDAAIRARAGGKKGSTMYDPNTPSFGGYSTDDVATMVEKLGLDRAEIRNVYDYGVGDVLIHNNRKGNFAKSLFGNDGNFNLFDKNIYKAVTPLIIGGYGVSQYQEAGEVNSWRDIKVNLDGIKKAIKKVESADGVLMINPESTATGLYGQRFSEIKDLYDGTREEFAKDLDAQDKFFMMRLNEGIEANETTPLLKDAYDLTKEYKPQLGDKWNYSYEDIIALSNFLGRGGARKYFGNIIRDGKPLKEVYPNTYGKGVTNKTPDEYLNITREFYQLGGEGNGNVYTIKKGDNLSRIARKYNVNINDITSINDISNPSLIYPGQQLMMPENSSLMQVDPENVSDVYTVKSGDSLSKIAKKYNTTYQRLAEVNNISNPRLIFPGQQIAPPPEYREEVPLAEEKWISTQTLKKNREDINALADEDIIIKSQMINNPSQRYVVVDKKNQRLKLYHGDEVITDFEVATGAIPGDAQTVTKAIDYNKDGIITEEDKIDGAYKVDWSKGNLSTGAGRYTISNSAPTSGDYYNNAPSFNLVNERGLEVSTAIHGAPDYRLKYFDNEDINDNRSSNGCINGKCSDLQGLYDMGLPNGTPVFILPEDEGNRFELVDGKAILRMSRENREDYLNYTREGYDEPFSGQGGNYTTRTLDYKPIRAVLDEERFKNDVFTTFDFDDEEEYRSHTIPFINALVENKKEIMKAASIPSDVYNEIAEIAFGIYGAESGYGDTHSSLGNATRGATKLFNKILDDFGLIEGRPTSNVDTVAEGELIKLKDKAVDTIKKAGIDTLRYTEAPDSLRLAGGRLANIDTGDSDDVSLGFTQLRWSHVKNNPKELAALKKLGITKKEDLLDPEKSAIATAVVLGIRYNEQLTTEQKKNIKTYLPLKWNSNANYPERVKRNMQYLLFEQYDRMLAGGEVEDKIIYSNYIDGKYDNTKSEAMALDSVNRMNQKYLKQARELGISPANYIMTYVISNS